MSIIHQKFNYFALRPFNMEGEKLQCFAKKKAEFQPFFWHPVWYKLYSNTQIPFIPIKFFFCALGPSKMEGEK